MGSERRGRKEWVERDEGREEGGKRVERDEGREAGREEGRGRQGV